MPRKTRAEVRQVEQTAIRQRLGTKCGSCIYLKKKHKSFAAPCADLGKHERSASCNQFDPHFSDLHLSATTQKVGSMIRGMDPRERGLLAYSIAQSHDMERATEARLGIKLQLGQPVAFRLAPSSWLNVWARGFAMGMAYERTMLTIVSHGADGKSATYALGMSVLTDMRADDVPSVMSWSQWKDHKAWLLEEGRINMPKEENRTGFVFRKIKAGDAADWTPLSIRECMRPRRGATATITSAALDTYVDLASDEPADAKGDFAKRHRAARKRVAKGKQKFGLKRGKEGSEITITG